MANLTKSLVMPNGQEYEFIGKTWYGVCSTAANTQTKTVSITGFTSADLIDGVKITVRFTQPQTYNGTPKLNVSLTGAKNIQVSNGINAGQYEWQAGEIITFIYYNNGWYIENGKKSSSATNWVNGSALLSVRMIGSTTENSNYTIGQYAVAEGQNTQASGSSSHVEGGYNIASGNSSHAEGGQNIASGNRSHVEGGHNIASGYSSHAEGSNNIASDSSSHAEGQGNITSGSGSHAEGRYNIAIGTSSHTEGDGQVITVILNAADANSTTYTLTTPYEISNINLLADNSIFIIGVNETGSTSSFTSRAPIRITTTTKSGNSLTGFTTETTLFTSAITTGAAQIVLRNVAGVSAHKEGTGTITWGDNTHVGGKWNVYNDNYQEMIGNGTDDLNRSNIRTLDWNGNEILAGKLTVGTAPTADMDVATKKYVDDNKVTVTSTYSATGTQAVNGTAVASAISTLSIPTVESTTNVAAMLTSLGLNPNANLTSALAGSAELDSAVIVHEELG